MCGAGLRFLLDAKDLPCFIVIDTCFRAVVEGDGHRYEFLPDPCILSATLKSRM
jgi:hypothetical protein